MWIADETGNRIFTGGQNAPGKAEEQAKACGHFSPDDEDEWVADAFLSCYNCRFRRWTEKSFICMKSF